MNKIHTLPHIRIENLIDVIESGRHNYIAHGCNTKKMMRQSEGGGGFAATLSDKYPEVAVADDHMIYPSVGKISYVKALKTQNTDIKVGCMNLYTQTNPGRVDSLELMHNMHMCFSLVKSEINKHETIGIPAIGCGIAGGTLRQLLFILSTLDIDNVYVYLHPSDKNVMAQLIGKTTNKFIIKLDEGRYVMGQANLNNQDGTITITKVVGSAITNSPYILMYKEPSIFIEQKFILDMTLSNFKGDL